MSANSMEGSLLGKRKETAELSSLDQPVRPSTRKQRVTTSCAECRRLKLKCDRQVPCSNCIRKSCANLCPEKTRQRVMLRIGSKEEAALPPDNSNVVPHERARADPDRTRPLIPSEDDTDIGSIPDQQSVPGQDASRNPDRVTGYDMTINPEWSLPSQLLPTSREQDRALISDLSHSDLPLTQRLQQVHQNRQHLEQNDERLSMHLNTVGSMAEGSDALGLWQGSQRDDLPNLETNTPARQEFLETGFDIQTNDNLGQTNGDKPVPFQPTDCSVLGSGTLVISHSGRSKFLGPTAGSEWLNDQEAGDEYGPSAMPSPVLNANIDEKSTAGNGKGVPHTMPQDLDNHLNTFPFHGARQTMSTRGLFGNLPAKDEAKTLVDCYYRHFAWHYNVCPRYVFDPLFESIYAQCRTDAEPQVNSQQLALLFIVLAIGTVFNLELLPNDPAAEIYCTAAQQCLSKGDFLSRNTIDGIRTVHIMAHYLLLTKRGSSGDSAWPLWGINVRLMHAMGLHRDGSRWNLSADIVDDRRRIFWETYTADVFQANCFSRPSAISAGQFDTMFPKEIAAEQARRDSNEGSGFYLAKFRLVELSKCVLDEASRIRPSAITVIDDLWSRIRQFEIDVPYELRCRPALLALPSAYPDPQAAIYASPEVARGQLQLTFQQHTLALNICEAVLFLQRPYFMRALHDRPSDPSRSAYGPSFLAVVERCHVVIAIVTSITELYPSACFRHWYLWYHVFTAAICMGSLVLLSPSNELTQFALSLIDTSIVMYSSAVQSRASQRVVRNLQTLMQLRQRAWTASSSCKKDGTAQQAPETLLDADNGPAGTPDAETVLLGWRTRLIARAKLGNQVATTINQENHPDTYGNISSTTFEQFSEAITMAFQSNSETFDPPIGNASPTDLLDVPTNEFLQQLWGESTGTDLRDSYATP